MADKSDYANHRTAESKLRRLIFQLVAEYSAKTQTTEGNNLVRKGDDEIGGNA